MKIGIDGLLLWGQYSGVEVCIYQLVQALGQLPDDHEYRLFVGRDAALEHLESERFKLREMRVHPQHRMARVICQQLTLPKALRREEVDLFHGPGYVIPSRCPVPAVVTIYDVIALSHPQLCRRRNVWHYRRFLPRSAQKAKLVIVPSAATRDELLRQVPISPEKIRVIPLAVDERLLIEPSPKTLAQVRSRYRLPGKFFLFVGNWEPKKNLSTLIRAFQRFREASGRHHPPVHHLVLAGKLAWGYRPALRLIEELGLRDQVLQLGYLPTEDLAAIYRLADALVFPSLVEGFGLPVLEAMSCGTPAITSNCPALRELAADCTLQVDPLDMEALSEPMTRMSSEPQLRKELSERGKQHAQSFSWRRTAQEVAAVYQEAVES